MNHSPCSNVVCCLSFVCNLVFIHIFFMTELKITYRAFIKKRHLTWGFRPKPRPTFCLDTKSRQKSQDFARFTRKTYARQAQIVQTRPTKYVGTQTGRFLTAYLTCFSAHRTRSFVSKLPHLKMCIKSRFVTRGLWSIVYNDKKYN